MPIAFYMNEHVPRAVTIGLRFRGVDALTVQEDGMGGMDDSALLDRAHELKRVIFTNDDDFLVEAVRRQREGVPFHGVIYAHPLRVTIGTCVENLEIIAKAGEIEDIVNRIEFLPL